MAPHPYPKTSSSSMTSSIARFDPAPYASTKYHIMPSGRTSKTYAPRRHQIQTLASCRLPARPYSMARKHQPRKKAIAGFSQHYFLPISHANSPSAVADASSFPDLEVSPTHQQDPAHPAHTTPVPCSVALPSRMQCKRANPYKFADYLRANGLNNLQQFAWASAQPNDDLSVTNSVSTEEDISGRRPTRRTEQLFASIRPTSSK